MTKVTVDERALVRAIERANRAGRRQGERRAFERVLLGVARRALAAEVDDVATLVATVGPKRTMNLLPESAREAWGPRWRENLSPVLEDIAQAATDPKATATNNVLPRFDVTNPRMAAWFDSYTSELARTLSDTSYRNALEVIREGIDEGLSVDAISERLRERLPELNRTRADLIARTETHNATEGANMLQARESGVVSRKVWRTAGDERVRPEHRALAGQEVEIDRPFSNGLDYPNQPGCRCTVEYVLSQEFGGLR